jgi:tRNA dimethylallyltransferase
MFSAGLVDETRGLVDRYGPVKSLEALGYRQAQSLIRGEASEAEAVSAAQQGHRNYAKRQLTWFRREPDVHWIEDFGDSPATISVAVAMVEAALGATSNPAEQGHED